MLRRVLKNECSKNDQIDFQALLQALSAHRRATSLLSYPPPANRFPPNNPAIEITSMLIFIHIVYFHWILMDIIHFLSHYFISLNPFRLHAIIDTFSL